MPEPSQNATITPEYVEMLGLLARSTKKKRDIKPLTPEEEKKLEEYFREAVGNRKLNEGLEQISEHPEKVDFKRSGIDDSSVQKIRKVAQLLRYFSYKSGKLGRVEEINARAASVTDATQPLNEEAKLSLAEFRTLRDSAAVYQILVKFGISAESAAPLGRIYRTTEKSYKQIEKINKSALLNGHYKAGDLLMVKPESFKVKGRKADLEEKLTYKIISKYVHAAQIFIGKDGQPKISHVDDEYEVGGVDWRGVATADVFRIDPVRLFPSNKAPENPEIVRERFQKILQNLHESGKERFKAIKNDQASRFKAGLANFGLFGGHKGTSQSSSEDLFEVKERMICSEFVARATITALKELQGEYPDMTLPPQLLSEKLDRLHPQRLIETLAKAGCLDIVPESDGVNRFVNKRVERNTLKKLYVEIKKQADRAENVESFQEEAADLIMQRMGVSSTDADLKKTIKEGLKEIYEARHTNTFKLKCIKLLKKIAVILHIKRDPELQALKSTLISTRQQKSAVNLMDKAPGKNTPGIPSL